MSPFRSHFALAASSGSLSSDLKALGGAHAYEVTPGTDCYCWSPHRHCVAVDTFQLSIS